MQLPTININGTDRGELLTRYMHAKEALDAAVEALGEASPHGRDYQTQEAGALLRAQREHADRMTAIRKVRAEIETIAEHII